MITLQCWHIFFFHFERNCFRIASTPEVLAHMWLVYLADRRYEDNFNIIKNILNGKIDSKLVKVPSRTTRLSVPFHFATFHSYCEKKIKTKQSVDVSFNPILTPPFIFLKI